MPDKANQLREVLNSTTASWIGLAIALVILGWIIHRLRVWCRDDDDPAESNDKFIRQFEESKLRGDLTDEEFRSIKSQVYRKQD